MRLSTLLTMLVLSSVHMKADGASIKRGILSANKPATRSTVTVENLYEVPEEVFYFDEPLIKLATPRTTIPVKPTVSSKETDEELDQMPDYIFDIDESADSLPTTSSSPSTVGPTSPPTQSTPRPLIKTTTSTVGPTSASTQSTPRPLIKTTPSTSEPAAVSTSTSEDLYEVPEVYYFDEPIIKLATPHTTSNVEPTVSSKDIDEELDDLPKDLF